MSSSSTSSYKRPIGGKLVLKGDFSKKKKKRKREKDSSISAGDSGNANSSNAAEDSFFHLVKLKGSGRIISSGTTVTGRMNTKFYDELTVGDAIVIQHPNTFEEETRIVQMVLSNVSISISSRFTSDLISSTAFSYIKAPPVNDNKDKNEEAKTHKKQEEASAFGTYAGGTSAGSEYTYRVKKKSAYGGYEIMKEKSEKNYTREQLLDKRSKHKADRHCN